MNSTPDNPADPTDASDNERPSATRLIVVLVLLGMGAIATWLLIKPGIASGPAVSIQLVLLCAAAALAGVPFVRRQFLRLLDGIRTPSPRARAWAAAAIWAAAFVYLIVTARQQHRDLFPRLHDECSYTIQAKMLAEGRLWLPKHEVADFFETFHFLTRPVYGSIYFPGTALMNVPGVWFRQPSWLVPVMLAALVIAMSYRVAAEMIDGVAGILVALLVLATSLFRVYSTMVMGQVPVMLLGLLMTWAWLRWRRERTAYWAALVGAFAGWAAITRPVEALAFALPIGLAMMWDVKAESRKSMARTAVLLLAGAAPFIGLQAVFDWGVTGTPWKTPYVTYLEQNQPGSVFGSAPVEMARPQTELPQKQIYFAQLTAMEQRGRGPGTFAWLAGRARMTALAAIPFAAAMLLIPAGLLIVRERGRWVLLAAVPIWFVMYAFNPFFLLHYGVPLAVVLAVGAVLGAKAVEGSIPWMAGRRFAGAFLPAALALLAIASLPQFNRRVSDEPYQTPLLDHVERTLAQIPAPAVVFFHFTPGGNVHEEPVYNMDATSPDDAPIVRAQDLGPRNGELIRYYAIHQPARSFYIMDRRTGATYPLGNAVQAAAMLRVPLNLPDIATADVR